MWAFSSAWLCGLRFIRFAAPLLCARGGGGRGWAGSTERRGAPPLAREEPAEACPSAAESAPSTPEIPQRRVRGRSSDERWAWWVWA